MRTEGVGNIQEYIILSEKNFFLHLNFEGWLHCFFVWHGVAFSIDNSRRKSFRVYYLTEQNTIIYQMV